MELKHFLATFTDTLAAAVNVGFTQGKYDLQRRRTQRIFSQDNISIFAEHLQHRATIYLVKYI